MEKFQTLINTSSSTKQEINNNLESEDDEIHEDDEIDEIMLSTLPKDTSGSMSLYKGCWYYTTQNLHLMLAKHKHIQALDSDIVLASLPKSGTTWLKALIFCIVHRNKISLEESPLLTTHPQDLVPCLDFDIYQNLNLLNKLPHPRIFSTHVHYPLLPNSIKNSKCHIVYICRNPLDQFVSYWHFAHKVRMKVNEEPPLSSMQQDFERFCEGVSAFGPFWDNVVSYWKVCVEKSDKILFMKYEDLIKKDIVCEIKKLAKFLGYSFSKEEEKQGLIDEIIKFCSLENLKKLDVNSIGLRSGVPCAAYFRKGEVGDYINYLTPSMADRLQNLVEQKLAGSGLDFKIPNCPKQGKSFFLFIYLLFLYYIV